jgi:hypothetical protein
MGSMGWPQTSGMAFNLNGNGGAGSIFIIGDRGRIAEINIPTPKLSALDTATVLQSNLSPFSYDASLQNDATAGIAYMTARGSQSSPKLYFGSFEYYNTDYTDYNSLGWAETDLSNTKTAGLWHVGPKTNDSSAWSFGVKSGEYLIVAPQTWADQYTNGRSLLIGRTREAGGAGGSAGPVLIATAPWASGNPPSAGTDLPATPLMYFSTNVVGSQQPTTAWQSWRIFNDPNWSYFNPGDRVNGGAWIDRGGKRALVLGMRHGTFKNEPPQPKYNAMGSFGGFVEDPSGRTVPTCYGLGGIECAGEIAISDSKGYHNGPYFARLVFIDIADLESVATGNKSPSSVTAYNVYNLMNDFGKPVGTKQDRDKSNDVAGVAYDEATGKLYIGQANGNDPKGHPFPAWPIIHVYQIGNLISAGGSSSISPTPPSNLRLTP